MAAKKYGYYIEGNTIAIVEKDTSFDNDLTSNDFGPGSQYSQWKSPLADIDDGLEIQYSYAPVVNLTTGNLYPNNSGSGTGATYTIFGWTVSDGYLAFVYLSLIRI